MNRRLADYHRSLIAGQTSNVSRRFQRTLLQLASFPYGWAVALRNRGYDGKYLPIHQAGVPVLSVGNLTAGGTGKTPMVEYLARWFQGHHVRVAILSRGYGGRLHRQDFSPVNDEALVLRTNIPDVLHLQGGDRVALARAAVNQHQAQLLLLDDGFQHRRLARHRDIVLLDATNPWGHEYLLPRGLLREPIQNLKRADIVVLTRCDQADATSLHRLRARVAKLAPRACVIESVHRPTDLINADLEIASFETIAGKPAVAFCGLGNPRAFEQTLRGLDTRLLAFRSYTDHHDYTAEDLRDLQAWVHSQPPGCVVLTSQKDLVKLRRTNLGGRELWAIRIQLEISKGQEDLDRRLLPLAARVTHRQEARAA